MKQYELRFILKTNAVHYGYVDYLGDESVIMYVISIIHNDKAVREIGIYERVKGWHSSEVRPVAIIFNDEEL